VSFVADAAGAVCHLGRMEDPGKHHPLLFRRIA
jgi:hypothetical protein